MKDYEPRLALDGGPGGLEMVSRLIEEAPASLRPGGHLILEIGTAQEAPVRALIERPARIEAGADGLRSGKTPARHPGDTRRTLNAGPALLPDTLRRRHFCRRLFAYYLFRLAGTLRKASGSVFISAPSLRGRFGCQLAENIAEFLGKLRFDDCGVERLGIDALKHDGRVVRRVVRQPLGQTTRMP